MFFKLLRGTSDRLAGNDSHRALYVDVGPNPPQLTRHSTLLSTIYFDGDYSLGLIHPVYSFSYNIRATKLYFHFCNRVS